MKVVRLVLMAAGLRAQPALPRVVVLATGTTNTEELQKYFDR